MIGPETREDRPEDDQPRATDVTEPSPDTDIHDNNDNNNNITNTTHDDQDDASSPSPDCRASKRPKTKA